MSSLSPSSQTPPSPTLTHASSHASFDPLDEFLDWSNFADAGANAQQPAIDPALTSNANGSATLNWNDTRIVTDDGDNSLLSPFGESLFPEQKSAYPFATIDPNFMASYTDSLTSSLPPATSAAEPVPPVLPPPRINYAESPIDNEMDEDLPEEPVKPVTRGKGKGRAKATAASSKPKRSKVTAVKDLELPLPPSETKPVIKFPTSASLLTEPAESSGHNLPHIAFPVPDYVDRPSAEEYKKMSSKEKRQLRNKISARNFRHRRKEYITTLEEEIASRDGTIAEMGEEMRTLKVENASLRTDLDALKKTFESLLEKAREGSPASTPSAEASSIRPGSSQIVTPNLAKDVSANWGAGGISGLGLRNDVGVHSALMPSPFFSPALLQQRNMNPRINALGAISADKTAHLPNQLDPADASFFGSNPYAPLASGNVDRYRSTMYSKIAHNLNGIKQSQASGSTAGFRPSFFAPLRSTETDENSAPLASPTTSTEADAAVNRAVAEQTAFVANVATNTLVSGLMSCFWSTFSGTGKNGSAKDVADLLAGRAEFQIVPKASTSRSAAEVDAGLVSSMQGLSVGTLGRAVTASGNVASYPSAGSSASIHGPMKSDKASGAWAWRKE